MGDVFSDSTDVSLLGFGDMPWSRVTSAFAFILDDNPRFLFEKFTSLGFAEGFLRLILDCFLMRSKYGYSDTVS